VTAKHRSLWITLALAALIGACEGKPKMQGEPAPASSKSVPGEPVPRLTGKLLSGEYSQIEDYRGKVVLLNVWATWCPPCRQELPELDRLHRELGPRGFTVVTINVDNTGDEPEVRKIVDEYGFGFPVVLDPKNRATQSLRLNGYPVSLLIDRKGTILWRRDGMIQAEDPELASEIQQALSAS